MSEIIDRPSPSIYDYMASSMLGIFTVWFWAQTAIQFSKFFEETHPIIISLLSYIFYTIGGTIFTYLVVEKMKKVNMGTGLKVSIVASLASSVYFYLSTNVTPDLILAIFVSFLLGGYLGVQIMMRKVVVSVIESK